MKHLNPDTLQQLYPPMSGEFAARMDKLLHTLPPAKPASPLKRMPFRLIFAAALIIAALSTTAFALTRPAVLRWLLGHNAPVSLQLEQSVQDIAASATAEGITVRITGAVYDSAQLAFSYAVENADPAHPVIVALDSSFHINGQEVPFPHPVYTYNVRMVPSPHLDVLRAQRNPVTGGAQAELPAGLQGQVECAVTFVIYRPEKAYAVLISPESALLDETITDAAYLAEIADSRATLDGFRNAILTEADESAAESWAAQGCTPVYEWGEPIFDATDARSHLTEVARITVPFTIDADNAIAHDFSGAAFQLADCTAEAVTFRLTPLSTYIHVQLNPHENTEAAARALTEKYGACTLTDEYGAPVQYSGMDYCSSPEPAVSCRDGLWSCWYLLDLPGLLQFPQSVGFTVSTGELFHFDLTSP